MEAVIPTVHRIGSRVLRTITEEIAARQNATIIPTNKADEKAVSGMSFMSGSSLCCVKEDLLKYLTADATLCAGLHLYNRDIVRVGFGQTFNLRKEIYTWNQEV
ncbi:hypothetical protein J41TS4_08540 [Paenibacillus apis]|uniref:Uncharacterized protein n=1 Tax=Paenibacillus apis TaxID=1792174 RepID=A0A920CI19_9BACL|nr:hypothetical protein J41TS4_08540 [Paenibacillus apis]